MLRMNIKEKISSMPLKQKIAQMFVMGFSGSELNDDNINIINAIKGGLGGVIFFADNIKSYEGLKNLTSQLQKDAIVPLFTSIDQEGGLVERTINCEEKTDYLTPMALANTNSPDSIKQHTQIMASELKCMGINMNFAPVLDVNTNKLNPVIGIRAFSNEPDEVIKYSKPVYETFQEIKIIPVGKHFPGHGEAGVDSHLDMPRINMNIDELEDIHIKPFKEAIENGLDAVMVAHVNYSAFNTSIPASLSREVITDYLKDKLGFKGLIISDDMVMGGIIKHYNHLDACIMAIKAGIDLFIFRDSSDNNLELIDKIAEIASKDQELERRINESVDKIINLKDKYGLFGKINKNSNINIRENQSQIDKIAVDSIKIIKKGNLLPLDNEENILILSPDKSQIFNYSKDKGSLSEYLDLSCCEELSYSLNPEDTEIKSIINKLQNYNSVIFISYNSLINKGQLELFKFINLPVIAVVAGSPYDAEEFKNADTIIQINCYKPISLKALANVFNMTM